jgi:uncharacterized protein DUF3551
MAALAMAVHVAPSDAHAALTTSPAHYCLNYNDGGTDCAFISLTQCNATADGFSAECSIDYAEQPKRLRSHTASADRTGGNHEAPSQYRDGRTKQ